jgi:hypothetical protein
MSIDYTPNNTFIFSFVRMNPPTPGHLDLIKTMIDIAIKFDVEKIYVITSSSADGKNPLLCSSETVPTPKTKVDAAILATMKDSDLIYKSTILNEMITSYKEELISSEPDITKKTQIQNLKIIVLCSAGRPFVFINNVINTDFIEKGISKINLYFVVGRDRADFLDTIIDYYKSKSFINSVDGDILERQGMQALKTIGMGDRTIADIDPSEYSASFVRKLVKENKKEDFEQVYGKYLNHEDIEKLYNSIKLGLQMKIPSKQEDENSKSIYFPENPESPGTYKKLLPIINSFPPPTTANTEPEKSGGKKTKKTKKIKKTKKTKKNIKNIKNKKNKRKTKKSSHLLK